MVVRFKALCCRRVVGGIVGSSPFRAEKRSRAVGQLVNVEIVK